MNNLGRSDYLHFVQLFWFQSKTYTRVLPKRLWIDEWTRVQGNQIYFLYITKPFLFSQINFFKWNFLYLNFSLLKRNFRFLMGYKNTLVYIEIK